MIGLEALRKGEIFEGLSDDELAVLARIAREETFPAGARIFAENDPATYLYIVRDGRVAILMDIGRGKQTVVDTVTANGSFGWSALVPPYLFNGTATAMEKTRVIAIPGNELRDLCQVNCRTCYAIMERLASIISNRLRDTRMQLISFMYA